MRHEQRIIEKKNDISQTEYLGVFLRVNAYVYIGVLHS